MNAIEEQKSTKGSELRSLIEKIDEKKRNELGGKKPVNVFTALNKSLDLIEELRSYLKVVEKNCIVISKKDLKEELRAARESAAKDLGKDKLGYATARGVVFYIERLLGQNSSDDKDKKTISE